MTKWNLKSCPHCGGDIYFEKEIYIEEELEKWCGNCLQCGYTGNIFSTIEEQYFPTSKESELITIQ